MWRRRLVFLFRFHCVFFPRRQKEKKIVLFFAGVRTGCSTVGVFGIQGDSGKNVNRHTLARMTNTVVKSYFRGHPKKESREFSEDWRFLSTVQTPITCAALILSLPFSPGLSQLPRLLLRHLCCADGLLADRLLRALVAQTNKRRIKHVPILKCLLVPYKN